MSLYALIVYSRETRSDAPGKPIMTIEGEPYIVLRDREGWVPATSRNYMAGKTLPLDTLTFKSREEAAAFAKQWKGHPWWCRPNGTYDILAIKPKYERHHVGFVEELLP